MSARESWTKLRARREEAMPGGTSSLATPMNEMNRCDRCGAQAYVRVLLHSGQDLLFCAHHYRQHALALAEVAAGIQDETERLTRSEWPASRS
jgi:hypothetical protein